jgi:hypothetical protein
LDFFTSKLQSADIIVIHSRWTDDGLDYVSRLVDICRETDEQRKIAIVGPRVEWKHLPTLIQQNFVSYRTGKIGEIAFQGRWYGRDGRINRKAAATAESLGVSFIDVFHEMCNFEEKVCHVTNSNKNILIYDHGHWSQAGQAYFGPILATVIVKTIRTELQ